MSDVIVKYIIISIRSTSKQARTLQRARKFYILNAHKINSYWHGDEGLWQWEWADTPSELEEVNLIKTTIKYVSKQYTSQTNCPIESGSKIKKFLGLCCQKDLAHCPCFAAES